VENSLQTDNFNNEVMLSVGNLHNFKMCVTYRLLALVICNRVQELHHNTRSQNQEIHELYTQENEKHTSGSFFGGAHTYERHFEKKVTELFALSINNTNHM